MKVCLWLSCVEVLKQTHTITHNHTRAHTQSQSHTRRTNRVWKGNHHEGGAGPDVQVVGSHLVLAVLGWNAQLLVPMRDVKVLVVDPDQKCNWYEERGGEERDKRQKNV